MARNTQRTRRKRALSLVAVGLGLGVLVGLLLAWQVWPVIWYDTDPCDLRVAHQTSWILMAADSYAITGDLDSARERLYELLDDDTTAEQVADLVADVAADLEAAGDSAGALRLQRLSQTVGMPSPGEAEFEPPRKRIGAPNKLTGYLVISGAAIVAAALLVRSLAARARGRVGLATIGRSRRAESDLSGRAAKVPPAAQEPSRVGEEAAGPIPDETRARSDAGQGLATAGPPSPTRQFAWSERQAQPDATRLGDTEAAHQEEGPRQDRPADFVPMPLVATAGPQIRPEPVDNTLGEFQAQYHLGDDQFDASFTINSPKGEFLGECGLGITDVLSSEGAQRVSAFEVWLFDRAEIRTVSKFLVSEYANQDEAIHDRLIEKGDLFVARPGLTFLVETLSIGLSVTVTDVAYGGDIQRPHSYFSRLTVQMVAKSIDSPVV